MYSNDLNNAYAYECERRKDEMREAAQSNLLRELRRNRKSSPRLVAALSGLALVLAVLSLLLMACSPQAAPMEPKANNIPEPASYQAVLGKSLSDKDVADFMAINNCSSAAQFQLCQDAGMAFWIDPDQIVDTVYLYSRNAKGFSKYKGKLPFGLTFYDPMWQVEQKLSNLNEDDTSQVSWNTGLPDEASSPDHIHYWAVYKELSMTIIYDSPGADEDAYIYAILLSK
jgi:hypothetical protein